MCSFEFFSQVEVYICLKGESKRMTNHSRKNKMPTLIHTLILVADDRKFRPPFTKKCWETFKLTSNRFLAM